MKLRALLAVIPATILFLAGAASADAAPVVPTDISLPGIGDCTDEPIYNPTIGTPGETDPGPIAPRPGDPFAENATTTMYEQYGWAGLAWTNYDLGCGPDALRNPEAATTGGFSNMVFGALVTAVSSATVITRFAFSPETLAIFAPLQTVAAEAFGNRVFMALFSGTLLVVMLGLIFNAAQGDVRDAANRAGWAVLVAVMAVAAFTWPTKIAPALDQAITSIPSTIHSALAGAAGDPLPLADSVAANIQRGILYETWKSGTFGRADSPTAEKYADELFKAQTLTRDEAAQIAANPESAAGIIDPKKERYAELADQIKDEDPIAYEYLAGHRNGDRLTSASLAWLGWTASNIFTLIAALLCLATMTIVRFVVMLLPLLAVVGAIWRFRGVVSGVLSYTAGAAWLTFVFGSLAAVFTAVVGVLMSPKNTLPWIVNVALLLVMTVVAWKLSKPMSALKTLTMGKARKPNFRSGGSAPRPAAPGAPQQQQQQPVGPSAGPSGPWSPGSGGVPAEARQRSFVGDTVRGATGGAISGAMTGAGLALITGGGSLAAGAAAGATKGAVVGAAGAHSPALGVLAAMQVSGVGSTPAAAPAVDASPAATTATQPMTATPAPTPAPQLPPGTSSTIVPADAHTGFVTADTPTGPVRVFVPGESTPVDNIQPVEPNREGVYPITTARKAAPTA